MKWATVERGYPADWDEISAYIRFTRAGGRCECDGRCGTGLHEGRCPNTHLNPSNCTGYKVLIATAHLDHHPPNVDHDNLMAMCQRCHVHYDKNFWVYRQTHDPRRGPLQKPEIAPLDSIRGNATVEPEQLAAVLGLTVKQILEGIKAGDVPTVKFGRTSRILTSAVLRKLGE